MLYFNDLQLWERQHRKNPGQSAPYTNLLARLGTRNSNSDLPHFYNFNASNTSAVFGKSLVVSDVVERIAQIASEHWYTMDINNDSNSQSMEKTAMHKTYMEWLPWKKYMNLADLTDFLER